MKRIYAFLILVLLATALATPVYANTASDPLVVALIAGQNQRAGDIKVWDDGNSLYVLYEAASPWCLTETQLAVASSLAGIPQSNGNPVPGQFPYKNTLNCVSRYLYKVPMASNACSLYIAAHAVVKKPGSTETAWGNGTGFSGKNWGMYFVYLTNKCSTPSPTNTNTPTATSTPTDTPTATNTPTATPTGTLATDTPTATLTSTATSTGCQPKVVTADFSKVAVGQSVEGLGVVAPGLNIDAKGTAVKLLPNVNPVAYFSNVNNVSTINGNMSPNGGFTDLITRNALQAHLYTFTFAPGLSVSNFSVHMLDFGDWNPTNSTNHYVSMTGYDSVGNVVAQQVLSYTTPPDTLPQSSDLFGNVSLTGDASAAPGQLGNWTWNISGSGMVKVVLEFGVGYDPNLALDTLSFTTECP